MEAMIKDIFIDSPFFLFGFVQGDVTGLLVTVKPSETIFSIMTQILQSSEIRTGNSYQYEVIYKDRPLAMDARLHETAVKPFERIDLRKMQDLNT